MGILFVVGSFSLFLVTVWFLVRFVDFQPRWCPKCGTIDISSRDKGLHQYTCSNCGYSSNDDRVGAMNIYELGKWYVSGVEKPAFTLTNE